MLELEKRRITKDEGAKAEKAMKALDIKPVESVNSEDVDFVVSAGHQVCSCMARSLISWLPLLGVAIGLLEGTRRERAQGGEGRSGQDVDQAGAAEA